MLHLLTVYAALVLLMCVAVPASPVLDALAQPAVGDARIVKVLIVFVKFADDATPGDPEVDYRKWPLFADPETLPGSAPYLISATTRPPFVDSTLTDYFYRQSNGSLIVFGDVYPRAVVTTRAEAAYHKPAGGYADLTYDVVQQLDRAGVDFSDYDYDGDGAMDQLFMVIRSDSEKDAGRIPWTGASCLDAMCANGPPAGRRLAPLTVDGTRIDWNLSGSVIFNRTPGNVSAHYWLVRMMAHEYGHDLWRQHFVHVPALVDNDVPETSNFRRPTNTLGYVLMAGAGGGNDARGDETISAFERELLGWIECRELDDTERAVTVRDLYTTGDCLRIDTGDARRPRTLFVTNRQRLGAFDRYRRAGRQSQFEIGLLRTTGLLIGIASGNRFEIIPADNSLVLSASNEAYQGDMYRPGMQLTPWTRPDINGYNHYPPRPDPYWHAIDNIRMDAVDDNVMMFDYVRDFRRSPVIRQDSWIGSESSGQTLSGRGRVVRGRLSVESDVLLTGRLVVEEGAAVYVSASGKLTIQETGSLIVHSGGRVTIEGEVHVDGILLPLAGSEITLGPGAKLTSGIP